MAEEEIRKGDYPENNTFRIDFKVLDGVQDNGTQLEDRREFPLRALLIILVYIGGLFGIVEYYLDKNSGTFITLPRMYQCGRKAVVCIHIMCTFCSISNVNTCGGRTVFKGAADILHMVVYVIAVTLFAWLVAIPVRRANAMISTGASYKFGPILCPVFINITAYVPFGSVVYAE